MIQRFTDYLSNAGNKAHLHFYLSSSTWRNFYYTSTGNNRYYYHNLLQRTKKPQLLGFISVVGAGDMKGYKSIHKFMHG